MTLTRQDVATEVRRWIGTPWRHQGQSLETGCDCAGMVIGVALSLGLPADVPQRYGRIPDGRTLRALCDHHMRRADKASLSPGAVVLMRWTDVEQHLGIIGHHPTGGMSLIHAYERHAAVVEHRLSGAWRARIVCAYDLPDVIA